MNETNLGLRPPREYVDPRCRRWWAAQVALSMVVPLIALAEVFWRMGLKPESFTADPWLAGAQAAIVLGAIAAGVGAGYTVRR